MTGEEVVLIAFASGLMSAVSMYMLMTDRERQDYKAYKADLSQLKADVKGVTNGIMNSIGYTDAIAKIVEKNRDELDEVVPEFRALKRWAYSYVSYRPGLNAEAAGDDHADE